MLYMYNSIVTVQTYELVMDHAHKLSWFGRHRVEDVTYAYYCTSNFKNKTASNMKPSEKFPNADLPYRFNPEHQIFPWPTLPVDRN